MYFKALLIPRLLRIIKGSWQRWRWVGRWFSIYAQSLMVWSFDADASVLPSGEKATSVTKLVWPSSVCSAAPDRPSQSLTVRSFDADASVLPSGEKATSLTK